MRRFRDLVPPGALTIALLAVALVATGLIAWQAYDAAATHRAATEAVLRDYAGLAASELVRRAANEVGYQGHYVLVRALGESRTSLTALARDPDPRVRRAATLVRRTVGVDPGSRAVALEGQDAGPVAAWLGARLPGLQTPQPLTVVHGDVAGEARQFVLAPGPTGELVGYEVETRALTAFVQAALGRDPLLPASLGHGRVGNGRLAVVVRDASGREVFRHGSAGSGGLRATVPFGDAYGGVLEGFTADVEVDPGAASDLVIGGLPQSRLPQLLALLGVAAGLLGVAVVQLRRDRALSRLRAEFVASASHELRTPLTQLRLFAETLRLDRLRSEEERRRSLEIIDREARRLGHLVENLLQFSRSERSAPGPAPEAQELGPLVAEVVESFRLVAARARITTVIAPGVRARVDADAWRQVLLNLLDNAVKYGPHDQEVRVVLEEGNGRIRLAVEDEGLGIPPGERERVFESFHRLDRDRASSVTGTGLGLAVVRDLVRRHGGRCAVESTSRGGARLVVELPPAGPQAPP